MKYTKMSKNPVGHEVLLNNHCVHFWTCSVSEILVSLLRIKYSRQCLIVFQTPQNLFHCLYGIPVNVINKLLCLVFDIYKNNVAHHRKNN